MVKFLGKPVRLICRFVISFYGAIWKSECFKNFRQTYTHSLTANLWRKKRLIICHFLVIANVSNRVHQCINLDGRYLNAVASKSKFVLQFLKNGKIFFNFTLLWINFNELWSTRVPLKMPNECYRIPYAVQCICDAINTITGNTQPIPKISEKTVTETYANGSYKAKRWPVGY